MPLNKVVAVAKVLGLIAAEFILPLAYNKARTWVTTQRKTAELQSNLNFHLTITKE